MGASEDRVHITSWRVGTVPGQFGGVGGALRSIQNLDLLIILDIISSDQLTFASYLRYESSTPTSQELSSSIFQSLSIRELGISSNRPNLHGSMNYIKAAIYAL